MHGSDSSIGAFDKASANNMSPGTHASTSASPVSGRGDKNMEAADPRAASKSSFRGIRLRASRACAVCHSRKVRCDVTQRYPCTNCAAFQCECVVPSRGAVAAASSAAPPASTTTKKRHKRRALNLPPSPSMSESASPQAVLPTVKTEPSVLYKPELKSLPDLANDPAFLGSASHLGLFMMKQMERDSATAQLWEHSKQRAGNGSESTRSDSAAPPGTATLQASAASSYSDSRPGTPPAGGLQQEAEAGSPPSLVDRETTTLLGIAGAFSTPPKVLADALVETYFQRIHPLLPVVDRSQFLRQWNSAAPGQPGGPPLLLAQALFCASANVCRHPSLLDSDGRNCSAKMGLYRKAKLLFDAGFEQDQEIVFCSALILSLALDAPDKASNNVFYWARTALTIAHSIGLHRRAPRGTQTEYKQRIRKRWWWSLFVRDRSVSTAYGRPMGISLEDSDVPMIETSDFDEQQPEAANAGPYLKPIQEHVLVFIYQVKLAEITGIILRQQYSVGAERLRALHKVPDISQCDLALATWVRNLPAEIRYVPRDPARHGYLQAVLHLQYYTTLCLAHRPQVVNYGDNGINSDSQAQYPSWGIAFHAAHMIVKVLENLGSYDELVVLPAAAVYSCFTALIMLLFQSESQDADARDKAREALKSLLASTNELGKLYEVARQISKYSPVILQSPVFKEAVDEKSGAWRQPAPQMPVSREQAPRTSQHQQHQQQQQQNQQQQQQQQHQSSLMSAPSAHVQQGAQAGSVSLTQASQPFSAPQPNKHAIPRGIQDLPTLNNQQSFPAMQGVQLPSINIPSAPSVVYPPHSAQGYYYGGSAADSGVASNALGGVLPGSHIGYAVMASAVAGANGINTSSDWDTVPPPPPTYTSQHDTSRQVSQMAMSQQMPQQPLQQVSSNAQGSHGSQSIRPMLPPVNQQLAHFSPQIKSELRQSSASASHHPQAQTPAQTPMQQASMPGQLHWNQAPAQNQSTAYNQPSEPARQSLQMVTLASGLPQNNVEPHQLFGEDTVIGDAFEDRANGSGRRGLAPEMLNMENWVQFMNRGPS